MFSSTLRVRRASAVAALLALTLGAAACGSDDGNGSTGTGSGAAAPATTTAASTGGGGGGGTVKLGAINALTGPFTLPDSSNAAKAYFDALNKKGGVNGTKIDYIVCDDKTDPAASATCARKLIQQDKVIGLVGGTSLVSCSVNQKLVEKADILDVMAGGATAPCFLQPNISPVNAGPNTDLLLSVQYAKEELGADKVCALLSDSPPTKAFLPTFKKISEKIIGAPLAYVDPTVTEKSNWTALMTKAKSEGCDVIINDGTPPQAVPEIKARDQQGITIPVILQGASYVADLPKAMGPNTSGVYVTAEMEPFTDESPILDPMKADLEAGGVTLNSLAQYGWQSANTITQVMKSIQGEITQDSLNKALRALTELDTGGMTGTPYSFGPGKVHNSNRSVKFVEVENGKWVTKSDWITLDPAIGA